MKPLSAREKRFYDTWTRRLAESRWLGFARPVLLAAVLCGVAGARDALCDVRTYGATRLLSESIPAVVPLEHVVGPVAMNALFAAGIGALVGVAGVILIRDFINTFLFNLQSRLDVAGVADESQWGGL